MTDPKQARKTINIVGLGYIGLPTALMFAKAGHTVQGFDVSAKVVESLAAGKLHIEEPGLQEVLTDAVRNGRFKPATKLLPADVHVVCVPTPIHEHDKSPDYSYVEKATKGLVPVLRKGDLVILESTVGPGTVRGVMAPILKAAGFDPETALHLAHCPETVIPGNMLHEIVHNARVIGGLTPAATKAAATLYASFVQGKIIETDATTAEFVKVAQNTYRDVNIALANELAGLCRRLGIDSREAIRVANHHPRVNIHQPGPGVGGHCIPVDPWFLVALDAPTPLIEAARAVNDGMPAQVVAWLKESFGGKAPKAPVFAVLGLAYKGNVDDARESPAFHVVDALKAAFPGCALRLNDPHVDAAKHGTVGIEEALKGADAALVVTDHDAYKAIDPAKAASLMRGRLVLDTRALLDKAAWAKAGVRVERV